MILAGDIGGTNTRLALFEGEPGALKPIVIDVFPSREHGGLEEIAEGFIAAYKPSLTRACFGIAGPVRNGVSETPNLPWVINAAHLADRLKLKSVRLLNDLEANAYGIAELGPADLEVLTEGTPGQEGNQALISAGTGLGEAGLLYNGTAHQPFPSEGGHADFAPRNALEVELLTYLLHRFEHVSYERVLSGPGLRNIYNFLIDTGRGTAPDWLKDTIENGDASAAISKAGLERTAEVCVDALDMLVSIYGAEAGNLALKMMATGGLFIGGGIGPKILAKLQGPGFLEAFRAKGRVSPLLESIRVSVITNDKTALLGAARVGLSL